MTKEKLCDECNEAPADTVREASNEPMGGWLAVCESCARALDADAESVEQPVTYEVTLRLTTTSGDPREWDWRSLIDDDAVVVSGRKVDDEAA